jgi:hypothetical protein
LYVVEVSEDVALVKADTKHAHSIFRLAGIPAQLAAVAVEELNRIVKGILKGIVRKLMEAEEVGAYAHSIHQQARISALKMSVAVPDPNSDLILPDVEVTGAVDRSVGR